jgi:hypothetical protein
MLLHTERFRQGKNSFQERTSPQAPGRVRMLARARTSVERAVTIVSGRRQLAWDRPPQRLPCFVDNLDNPAVNETRLHEIVDCIGRQAVVRVEKKEDIASTCGEASIDTGALATVLGENRADPVAKPLDDFARLVRGTIVHDNDLDIRVRLIERTFNRFGDEPAVIVI